MIASNQVLVRPRHGKLLVLHLGFGHVVVARVEVLLLCGKKEMRCAHGFRHMPLVDFSEAKKTICGFSSKTTWIYHMNVCLKQYSYGHMYIESHQSLQLFLLSILALWRTLPNAM